MVGLASTSFAVAEEWERAVEPREWSFPRDHGAHHAFRTEWWYFTGNMEAEGGRHFGYQFTIFRQGVVKDVSKRASKWALRDVLFAHFTVTDSQAGKFHFSEKASRGAMGEAWVSGEGMDAEVEGWKIETVGNEVYRVRAEADGYGIDLTLSPLRPLVFQGRGGLSQKAAQPGNASHYYSYTRLAAEGIVRIGEKSHPVKGLSWFDHEFSTSSLGEEQVGWDWFCIQLDSGDDLMLYQMRRKDGTADATSHGLWIAKEGKSRHLSFGDYRIRETRSWTAPGGRRYPGGWELEVGPVGLKLTVDPVLADQELRLRQLSNLRYWEGSCAVKGTLGGAPVSGRGYTELSGYGSDLTGAMR